MEIEGDKAPVLDGFTMACFQKCYSVVELDVMVVFEHFHRYLVFERSLNASFLSLIHKKNNAIDVMDFRPISLVGSVYKLMFKVLAKKLRVMLDSLISESQMLLLVGNKFWTQCLLLMSA